VKTKTARLVDNLAAMYYRRDRPMQLVGRNSAAGDQTLDANWRRLQAALEAGGFEELDADPRLAARYRRLERRHLLGEKS
jgi:hypothetical protein